MFYFLIRLRITQNTHDWSIDKAEKADLKKDLTCMIDCVKVQPHLFVLIRPKLGPFLYFFDPSELFLGLGSGSKTFLVPAYID